ncbi:MAG: hypothetical protein JO133_08985 [Burkholderiaceae bacterium]|nr:hypothetical protein [Burkholderiaceae bacterium]
MEIDPIVTAVQEIGSRLGIATPAIDLVAALIKLRQRTARLPAGGSGDATTLASEIPNAC